MKSSRPLLRNQPPRSRFNRTSSGRFPLRNPNPPQKTPAVPIVLALRLMARKPATTLRKIRIAVWNELRFTKIPRPAQPIPDQDATMP